MRRSSAFENHGAAGDAAGATFQIAARSLLIAVPDGRCWTTAVGSPEVTALPVSPLAAERSTLAASAVEGAMAAGLARTACSRPSGPYTLLRYIRWLAGNYVFAGQTPGLFRRGAERLLVDRRQPAELVAR